MILVCHSLRLSSLLETVLIHPLCVIIRFVEPIDRSSYKHWSSASPQVTQMDCEQPGQSTCSGSDCDNIKNNQTAETSAQTEATQLSFTEVMRLVQEGKEVPGVKKLDIKPTNQSPTPSQMERRSKPWEISSVSE